MSGIQNKGTGRPSAGQRAARAAKGFLLNIKDIAVGLIKFYIWLILFLTLWIGPAFPPAYKLIPDVLQPIAYISPEAAE